MLRLSRFNDSPRRHWHMDCTSLKYSEKKEYDMSEFRKDFGEMAEGMSGKAESLKHRMRDTANQAREFADQARETVDEKLRSAGKQVSAKAEHLNEVIHEKVDKLRSLNQEDLERAWSGV